MLFCFIDKKAKLAPFNNNSTGEPFVQICTHWAFEDYSICANLHN